MSVSGRANCALSCASARLSRAYTWAFEWERHGANYPAITGFPGTRCCSSVSNSRGTGFKLQPGKFSQRWFLSSHPLRCLLSKLTHERLCIWSTRYPVFGDQVFRLVASTTPRSPPPTESLTALQTFRVQSRMKQWHSVRQSGKKREDQTWLDSWLGLFSSLVWSSVLHSTRNSCPSRSVEPFVCLSFSFFFSFYIESWGQSGACALWLINEEPKVRGCQTTTNNSSGASVMPSSPANVQWPPDDGPVAGCRCWRWDREIIWSARAFDWFSHFSRAKWKAFQRFWSGFSCPLMSFSWLRFQVKKKKKRVF